MTTNARLKDDSELYKRGQELIAAAHSYWQEYQKHFRRSAVVWLEDEGGSAVVFTRGEYKREIMSAVEQIDGEPLPEHLFEKR